VLVVIHHEAQGAFAGFDEIRLTQAETVRE
jgi:hypothetical protein